MNRERRCDPPEPTPRPPRADADQKACSRLATTRPIAILRGQDPPPAAADADRQGPRQEASFSRRTAGESTSSHPAGSAAPPPQWPAAESAAFHDADRHSACTSDAIRRWAVSPRNLPIGREGAGFIGSPARFPA